MYLMSVVDTYMEVKFVIRYFQWYVSRAFLKGSDSPGLDLKLEWCWWWW